MTRCPDCNAADAYIGLRAVECTNPSCARYSKKWAFTARKGDLSVWTPPAVESHQAGGLLPYREPAKQLRAVKGRCGPGRYLCWKYNRDLCDVCAGRQEPEREYASEKGVLRPIAPRVETGVGAFSSPGANFSRARAGEYFDQIAIGGEGGVVVGEQHEFFRDLGGKMPQGGKATWCGGGDGVVLATNMHLCGRICHGEEAILKRASVRLIDAPTGGPASEETAFWLGNTFLRFEINDLLQVEGQLWRFYDGILLAQEPYVCSDHHIGASLKVGRGKIDLPCTIVSFALDALILSATTRG